MKRHTRGGQYRAPVGLSTMDGETDAVWLERLRRAYAALGEVLDEAKARQAITTRRRDPRVVTDDYCYTWESVQDFERERRELAGEADVPW